MEKRRRSLWKSGLAGMLSLTVVCTSIPVTGLDVQAAEDAVEVTYEHIRPYYNVDCGDFDVTTAPAEEDFGLYQSVTEQVYGEDPETGKNWGIVDNYEAQAPDSNLKGSGTGGVDTDWTWPHENGGWSTASPNSSTNRYTKNQWEESASFGNTRKLDYAFELPAGTYNVEVLCTDPWGVSKNPSLILNEGQDSQVDVGTCVPGTPKSGTITLEEDGELTVNLRGTDGSTLAVNVAYIVISNSEYGTLYRDYWNISLDSTVRGDFTLTQATGENTITWESDKEEAIRIEGTNAIVTRGEEDQKVNLTATISNGGYYVKKTIPVTVKAINATESNIEMYDFANEEVEVTDEYYNNSFDKDVEYLVSMDTDRMLAGFRETAAYAAGYDAAKRTEFMRNAARYDGWENTRIGGHTLGHYMSSLARAYANPEATEEQKQQILEKANACADGLRECQLLTEDSPYCEYGYLFGATIDNGGTTQLEYQFDRMEGKTSIGGDWVPWYTMHKILAGLVDVAKYTENQNAMDAAVDLGLWVYNRVNSWDAAMKNRVLGIEYGGMNDALYDLYALAEKEEDYRQYCDEILRAAEQFDEITLFEQVKNGGSNILNNRHANTTIPKFIGALKRYIVLGEDEAVYLEYAEKFWDMVITHHTYITGGNSENEHFGADDILYGEESTVNCETCNTYNMLKLTRELFKITGDVKYSDYYENTLINAIMSSQNPETGMSMYFQPMASGYHKVFGKPTTDFWCCTGSGMENFTKLNDSIYFHMDDTVIVNQYLSSILTWDEKNVKITQESGIQTIASDQATFQIESLDGEEVQVNLALRIPDWVADQGNQVAVSVNGEPLSELTYFDFEGKEAYAQAADQERYVFLTVKSGDTVTIQTPMETVAHNLPDSENTYAFKYGPVMLSAKLGSDPAYQTEASHGIMVRRSSTSAVSSDQLGIYAVESVEEFMEQINDYMVHSNGNVFHLQGVNCSYDFVPHYSQYTDNYGIYWTYYVGERDSDSIIKDKDTNRKNRVTIDSLQAGYGQYEPGLDPSTGHVGSSTEHTRYATAGGYFEYEIKVDKEEPNYLMLTLRREDDGKPLYVTVNGETVYGNEALDGTSEEAIQGMLSDSDFEKYYQVRIPVPDSAMDTAYENSEGQDVVRFRFAGTEDRDSACLYNWSYCVRGYRTENSLTGLQVEGENVSLSQDRYEMTLPVEQASFQINAMIEDAAGYVAVNGKAVEEGTDAQIELTGYVGDYEVTVYAENFEPVESFTIHVEQDVSGIDLSSHIKRYYSFDETLGDALTVQKATIPSPIDKHVSYVDGAAIDSGKAIHLDGTFGLRMGSANDLGESYTISYWMKPDALGSDVDPTFCAGVFDPEYWFSATFDGKLWSYKNGYISTASSNAYRSGEWQYVTIVVDGSQEGTKEGTATGTLYVNGEQVVRGDVASGVMTNSNALLYFGVNRWDNYFKGSVDDLMMLDMALDQREVRAFMDGTIQTDGTGITQEEITEVKNVLNQKIEEAEGYAQDDYTEDSYQVLKDALEAAKSVYENTNATIRQVKNAQLEIEAAIKGLVMKEDEELRLAKEALNEKIQEAAAYEEKDYTEASYQALQESLKIARSIYENETATLKQVADAKEALEKAIEALVTKEEAAIIQAKAVLNELIREAESYEQADYTEASYQILQKALETARSVYEDASATLKQVTDAEAALSEAIEALVSKEEESLKQAKIELQEQMEKAKEYQEEDYTTESYQILKEALERAAKVLEDEKSTQEQISAAKQALNQAIDNLEKKTPVQEDEIAKQIAAAKASLQAKINQAAAYRESDYTDQSYSALRTALEAARNVVNNAGATLDQINAASAAIDSAVKNLQKAVVSEEKPVSYKGKTVKVGNYKFKITKHSDKAKEAAFVGVVKKKETVKIPATFKYKGIRFKVTSIRAKALSGNKKVKRLVIGNNVKIIGQRAFYGCRNLKTIVFNGKQVTKIQKGAFLKIKANASVKVPKSVKKKYRKLLNKKVISRKAVIK